MWKKSFSEKPCALQLSSFKREPGVGCESPDLPLCEAVNKEKAQRRIEEEEERRRKADVANTIALEGIKVAFDEVSGDGFPSSVLSFCAFLLLYRNEETAVSSFLCKTKGLRCVFVRRLYRAVHG